MNPDAREIKRRRRTALTLYTDARPLDYIARALNMTEGGVVDLLTESGVKNIAYTGVGTPDPLLEAPVMPKKQKTYEELLVENLQLRSENARLHRRLECVANQKLVRS